MVIMELETNDKPTLKTPDITEEVRLSATTRQVTLTPLHDDIVPEKLSDSSEAARSADEPIANVPGDTESTFAAPDAVVLSASTPVISTATETTTPKSKAPIAMIAGAIGVVCVTAIVIVVVNVL